MAIFEGDIALGTVEQLERVSRAAADAEAIPVRGIAITGDRFRWPGGVIPYEIDSSVSNPQRITDAMAEWSDRTPLLFVERDEANPAHANYISFEELDGCWSQVGMRGGKQVVSIGPSCGLGSIIHEIGHVAGLWHEQGREDRDQFIRILWENIQEGREHREHNFDQHITDGDDIGSYDHGSIMHYPALAFSRNGQPTIVARGGQAIGQRIAPSELDIATVVAMYSAGAPQPGSTSRPGESGIQRLGTIPPYDVRRWFTQDWPIEWNILWTVIPSPQSVRVEWKIVTERQSGVALKYYIEVRNLSANEATVDARYTIL
jgi:hypothetical protein